MGRRLRTICHRALSLSLCVTINRYVVCRILAMKPPVDSVHVPAVQQKKQRKRPKRLLWSSPKSRYRPSSVVRRTVFHLPTRTTLTYAEAQRFVDVYMHGSVTRLNVAEPLSVVSDCDANKYHDNSSECNSPSGQTCQLPHFFRKTLFFFTFFKG